MFLVTKSTSPKNGKPGRLQICEVVDSEIRILVDIETKSPSPYKRVIKYKTGPLAKKVRRCLIESGLTDAQCNIILRTGIYDERNGGIWHLTPEQLLSKQRSKEARMQHAIKRSNERGSLDLASTQQ